MTGDQVRVLIVDDDDLMRAGLQAVITTDPSIVVVGTAGDGRAAIQRSAALRPDVVLLDVRMPVLDGVAATAEVLAVSPETKVVILTTFEQDDYIFGALAAGAAGFLLKRTRPEELIAAIHTIAAGDALLSPAVTRRVIDRMPRLTTQDTATSRLTTLTPRERDVLELLASGLSNAEIAAHLTVELSTVKSHVKRILAKLYVRDRVHAVIFAYDCGLVRPGASPRGSGT